MCLGAHLPPRVRVDSTLWRVGADLLTSPAGWLLHKGALVLVGVYVHAIDSRPWIQTGEHLGLGPDFNRSVCTCHLDTLHISETDFGFSFYMI